MIIIKESIGNWLNKFESDGVLIGLRESQVILDEIKSLRKLDRLNGEDNSKTISYRRNLLVNLIMSSQEYLDSGCLDIRTFLKNYKDSEKLRVYPKYNLTPTYRLSTSDPCIGNLDSNLKRLIVPRDGYDIVSVDYKNQEPWIIVNLIENKDLLDILECNEDFYYGMLSKFGVLESEDNRVIMKTLWNASVYGSSLSRLEGSNLPWVVEVYNWVNSLKEVQSLRDKVGKNIFEGKAIYTLFNLNRSISYDGYQSVRKAFNSIFQMSGSGVLYTGLETIHSAVLLKENDINIYFTNHDEYILESSSLNTESLVNDLLNDLDFGIEGWTYPKFEIKIGNNWGDCV